MISEPSFAPNQWDFDERVTEQFDEMLSRSIPYYESMRQSCYQVGKSFVQTNTDIVDLGCSRGEASHLFLDNYGATIRYALVEASEPMFNACLDRYKGWVEAGVMTIKRADLRTFYPHVSASLTLSVLTLMFVPIEYRQALIQKVFKTTLSGGAFILVEKVLGASADIDEAFCAYYRNLKLAHGYSTEEVERKRMALEGRLVPVTARWNEELLRSAGFSQVDCFWRWMNFAAWIAVKN